MVDIKKSFWDKVRALRQQQWFSQEAFAAKCKIHRTYMGLIERGKANVTLEQVEKIAKVLWVAVDILLKDHDN
jgi:transcriptional regulator with XRE-family HTH domain